MSESNPLLDDEQQVSYLAILNKSRTKYSLYLLVFLVLIIAAVWGWISLPYLLVTLFIESAYILYELKECMHVFHYSENDEIVKLHLLGIRGDKKEINLEKSDLGKIRINRSNKSIKIPELKKTRALFRRERF